MQACRVVFSGILLLSLVSIAQATVEYLGFFIALRGFQFEASSIYLIFENESVNVVVDFNVSNPTWYGGLHLRTIISTLYYEGENHTIVTSPGGPRTGVPYQAIVTRWWELPEGETNVNRYLLPSTVLTPKLNLTLTAEQSKQFLEFVEKRGKYQEFIRWRLRSRVYLATPTFLDDINLEYQFYLNSSQI